jgi:Ca2+-binding RTX toxin-like protein
MLVIGTLATGLVAGLAGPASATVTCSLASGTLTVNVSGSGTELIDITERPGGTFEVGTLAGDGTCTGGPATTANTDRIEILDTSDAASNTTLTLRGLPFLESTDDEGDGTSEVEVKLDVGAGTDDVRFHALAGPVRFRLGTLGVNTNADETTDDLDIDISNMADVEDASVVGTDSGDVISGAGGQGTGTAFPQDLRIDAFAGPDNIRGGAAVNILFGYAGNDTISCEGSIVDTLDYAFSPPVRVDLQANTATGDGTDTIVGTCEAVGGSNGPDVLRGEPGPQFLFGRSGNDVATGRAGDDFLFGEGSGCTTEEGGNDTISYAFAPDGVSVDLAAGSGGSPGTGSDLYCNIDNVVGGDHSDILQGDGTPNVLTGGGDADTLNGRGGPDTADYSGNPGAIQADLVAGSVVGASTDTLTSIERVIGTSFADTIEGSGGANRLSGLGGADRLVGRAGRDRLDGGSGGDDLIAGAGRDRLLGRQGADLLDGGAEVDFCKGGPGRDTRRRCERGRG